MNDDILTPSSQHNMEMDPTSCFQRVLSSTPALQSKNTVSTSCNSNDTRTPSIPSPKRRNVICKKYEPKHFVKGSPPTTQSPKYQKPINYSHPSRVTPARNGYQKFQSISVELTPDEIHERGQTVQIVPQSNVTLPTDNPIIPTSADSSASNHFDGVHGKITILQNVNAKLRGKVAEQSKEIQALKTENLSLSSELQKYKLLAQRNCTRSERPFRGSDAARNPLFRQLMLLKEELDKTRHRLLQYEIFDENSEIDIDHLLNSVNYNATVPSMDSNDDPNTLNMNKNRSDSTGTRSVVTAVSS